MMTIREYLQMVLNTEGFEAYEEAEEALIEAYEADDETVFEAECEARGIDTTDVDEVNAWVWDWCD